jgi:hypothetical protein
VKTTSTSFWATPMSGILLLFRNLSGKGLNRTEMRGITESVTDGARNKESRLPQKENRLSISDPPVLPQAERTERTSSVALLSVGFQGETSKVKDFSLSCRPFQNL